MKSGKPKKASKVNNPNPKGNFMRESDLKSNRKSAQLPMKRKRLSK